MLHPSCEQRILNLCGQESVRQNFLDMFRAVANDAEQMNLPHATCVVPMYDEDSDLKPGDWAAELHFVVRKVESVDDEHLNSEGPSIDEESQA